MLQHVMYDDIFYACCSMCCVIYVLHAAACIVSYVVIHVHMMWLTTVASCAQQQS